MDNKELLQSAKDEAAREYGYADWGSFIRFVETEQFESVTSTITNRAMEIYAEKVIITPELARRILGVRDAIVEKDYDEAWHELYQIASPNFDKQEPWEELEQIASIKTTQP